MGLIKLHAQVSYRMRLFVLFITVIYATFLSAQVYKWVDENGKTHYSDKPHDENAEAIHIEKTPTLDTDHDSRVEKQRRLLEVMAEERQETKQLKAQAAAEKLKREVNCAKARKNLQDIMNAGFLYKKTNDPLNLIVYSDEERKDITTKAKKAVQDWCK